MKKLILYLISFLYKFTDEKITVDNINSRVIRPVPGLIIDGRQLYEFLTPADMPQGRLVHFNYFREEIALGIDRETQKKFIQELYLANGKQDFNRIAALLFMFEDMITNVTSVETMYNLASLMYFYKDEDVSKYDADYNRAKIAGFKKLQDQSFFFTRLLREGLKHTGASLPQDMQAFLAENAAKLSAYQRILSANVAQTQ